MGVAGHVMDREHAYVYPRANYASVPQLLMAYMPRFASMALFSIKVFDLIVVHR